jgi:hypothetical protein
MTPPRPEATSQMASVGVIVGRGPEIKANGVVTASPTTIIQATVEEAPMRRLDRDEAKFAAAQQAAAPRPPRMAIMRPV